MRDRHSSVSEALDAAPAAKERAWAAMETATMPRFYLDLRKHRESHALGPDDRLVLDRLRRSGKLDYLDDDVRGRYTATLK